jgi:hypothetical protein
MARIPTALVLALLALPAAPALAAPRITEDAARAFLARQERAWNAGDLETYFAGFIPQARFTDQAYVGDKPPARYGTSTRAEARAQARKALAAGGGSREAGRVLRVTIAPDGQSADVALNVGSLVRSRGHVRRMCAARTVRLVLRGGALKAGDQTDTYVKCRGG